VKNVREYYIQCFDSEAPTFIKVMKAVPSDKAAYTPHPRSTAAGDLVWLLAAELHDACELIDSGEVNYVQKPAPAVAESIAAYEKNAAALKARLTKVDDAKWDSPARLKMDGKVMWEAPLGDMLFGFLLVLAWKTAGYIGLDRFLLPLLGTPWRSDKDEKPQRPRVIAPHSAPI